MIILFKLSYICTFRTVTYVNTFVTFDLFDLVYFCNLSLCSYSYICNISVFIKIFIRDTTGVYFSSEFSLLCDFQ